MVKKDKRNKDAKKARLAEKRDKASKKSEQKNKKLIKKQGDDEFEDDVDIDELLSSLAKEQELFEAVNVENVKKPAKRLNSTLISNNNNNGKNELILFGGETTNNGLSHFYNDLHVYSIDNDTWKRITSKNSPLPRSSHAMCNHPSGIILMFGGEFSSPKQSTFYHYGDTWILDSQTKEWMKVDYKKGPLARSGHRLTHWKNYVIMHGGFRDLGTTTTYLNDLWLFDITSYKWHEVQFPPNHTIPDSRSGHSLIPTAEGVILWGGYTKVKAGKGLQKGKVLTDCWSLKMKSDPTAIRWERRRKQGFQPSPRVGTSMCYHKGRGILFGGVYDYDESEENLESTFYNSLFTFNVETNRWHSQTLRSQKRKVAAAPKKEKSRDKELEDLLNSILAKANLEDDEEIEVSGTEIKEDDEEQEQKKEYEIRNQLPHERFNSATTVIDDVLYIYGGVWESGEQEFNLDSLYAIDLGKLDGCKVLWEDLSELDKLKEDEEDDEDDEDDDDEDDDEDDDDGHSDRKLVAEEEEEEEEEIEEEEPEIPDLRPWLPHPKAFESLRAFYVRTGAEFLEWSISQNRDVRGGKLLKSLAFDICEDRWWERRDQVRIAEDSMEELGNVSDVIEKDTSKPQQKRR